MSAQMQLELTDPQTEAEALAKLFRQKRVLRGLKQCHVAPKLGVSPAAVSSLESVDYLLGRRNGFPSKLLIQRACAFYELDSESICARMLRLKIATGQKPRLQDGNHCGKRVGKHKSNLIQFPHHETVREVEEFDFSMLNVKPGIEPEVLLVALLWGAVVVLTVIQLFWR